MYSPACRERAGFPFNLWVMDIDLEIERCQDQMAWLWKITQNLLADGIQDSDPVFDQLAEKTWSFVHRLESLYSLIPDNRFTLGPSGITPEFPIPGSVLDNFTPYKLGRLNPNDHHHLQNWLEPPHPIKVTECPPFILYRTIAIEFNDSAVLMLLSR